MTLQTGVSYFSARTLRHVQADLADMVAHHCTYVIHCLTETDLAYYADTMREIVRATHQAGLELRGDDQHVPSSLRQAGGRVAHPGRSVRRAQG